jgi:hypothetical protein
MKLSPELCNWLTDNPWAILLGLIFGAIGVLSIPIGIILHRKSRRIRKLVCESMSTRLIAGDEINHIESLEIFYDKEPIENLTHTILVVANAGNEWIEGNEVPSDSPITIKIRSKYRILDANVVSFEKDSTSHACRISDDGMRAFLDFDYIDSQDSLILTVHHTGKSDHDITIEGKLKGGSIFHKHVGRLGRMQVNMQHRMHMYRLWAKLRYYEKSLEKKSVDIHTVAQQVDAEVRGIISGKHSTKGKQRSKRS